MLQNVPDNLIKVEWGTCCPACLKGSTHSNKLRALAWIANHKRKFKGKSVRYVGMIVDTYHEPFISRSETYRGMENAKIMV